MVEASSCLVLPYWAYNFYSRPVTNTRYPPSAPTWSEISYWLRRSLCFGAACKLLGSWDLETSCAITIGHTLTHTHHTYTGTAVPKQHHKDPDSGGGCCKPTQSLLLSGPHHIPYSFLSLRRPRKDILDRYIHTHIHFALFAPSSSLLPVPPYEVTSHPPLSFVKLY